nr:DUF6114 domain-containing protein [uncultured Actinoplanes sp.]
MATDDGFWAKFRRWRRQRPFWGALLLVLSGIEYYVSGNLTIGGFEIHLGPTGFLSYLIPLIVLLCGLLSMFSPAQRLFYGIIALVTALYSLIGLNLGGFFAGMLLALIGGALVVAWGPPRVRPDDTPQATPDDDSGDDAGVPPSIEEVDAPTERIDIAGHDDRPTDELRPAIVPGMQPQEPPHRAGPGRTPKALAVALVALAITASFLVAGSTLPARAEVECPEGLPSRSSTPSSSRSSSTATSSAATSSAVAKPSSSTGALPGKVVTTSKAASQPAAASSSPATDDDGNPIVDGLHDIVDGVGNLLGIGDEESPSPSTSPTPSESSSAEPSPGTSPTTTANPGDEPTKPADPSSTADPTTPATTPASATPKPGDSEIPCLGARLYGKAADADGLPYVAGEPGQLTVKKLTMRKSTYEGTVDLPTATHGTYKALQFNMEKAINEGFVLTIDEPSGGQTVIVSDTLTTTGNVRFYTSQFKGKLFGVIPVTFTPERPPPLTIDPLIFTDVTLDLSYVRCDELTGDPLKITEKP